MIIGIVPIGGRGSRLGLPFSKEMLPQKDFGHYNPVSNHLVQKMIFAGAQKIIFIHGEEKKIDVLNYYSSDIFVHVKQRITGFAQVLKDVVEQFHVEDEYQYLFGLPDSIFEGNPFIEMLSFGGVCTGLFLTNSTSKVDRLLLDRDGFDVKSPKNFTNSDYFWGVLKFDGSDLKKFNNDDIFRTTSEVGDILNMYGFHKVFGGQYIDIGTWDNYNKYLSRRELYPSTEIEKKYICPNVDEVDFINKFKEFDQFSYDFICSTDYYFDVDNDNIEFVRYRGRPDGGGFPPDITIKNIGENSLNRYELVVPLDSNVTNEAVLTLLKMLGARFNFKVHKKCHIFTSNEVVVVMYSFPVLEKLIKIIEVELLTADFSIISKYEDILLTIPGFSIENHSNLSKFKLIKGMINDSPH